jgi:predicted transcriptional regulator
MSDEVVMDVVLTPVELKLLRKSVLGWSLKFLAKSVSVSTSQLCSYEKGNLNLRPAQLRKCSLVLNRGLRDRSRQIVSLLAGQSADDRLMAG